MTVVEASAFPGSFPKNLQGGKEKEILPSKYWILLAWPLYLWCLLFPILSGLLVFSAVKGHLSVAGWKVHLQHFYCISLGNGPWAPLFPWHSLSSRLYTGFRNHHWGNPGIHNGDGGYFWKKFLNHGHLSSTVKKSLKLPLNRLFASTVVPRYLQGGLVPGPRGYQNPRMLKSLI